MQKIESAALSSASDLLVPDNGEADSQKSFGLLCAPFGRDLLEWGQLSWVGNLDCGKSNKRFLG
jgi:hypothetical protein